MNTSGWPVLARGSRRWLRLALVLAVLLSLLPAAPAAAGNATVGQGGFPCTEAGLNAAIAAAGPGGSVEITCDKIDIEHTIQLLFDIFIGGLGDTINATINAHGNDRVFDIHAGAHILLASLTIRGGNAATGDGGNIYNGGTLRLSSCNVIYGEAENGGGIANGPGASLTLTHSFVLNNRANLDGGGVWNPADGEVIDDGRSVFTGNSAGNDGGGIYSGSSVILSSGTSFANNTAGFAGGGMNVAGLTDVFPHGPSTGALLPAGPDLAAATAAVAPTLFISNSAGGGGGGAIFNTGHLTLSNVEILSNSTSYSGGGIESYTGTVQISNALLAYNRAGANYGGGAIENGWTLTATAMAVISNTGGNQGGGLDTYHGTVVISDSTFMSNTASLGGGISVNSGSLRLDSSTVADNAVSSAGGGLYQGSGASTVIANSTFSGNTANNFLAAGGLESIGVLTITSSTLVSNSTPGSIGNLRTGSGGATWLGNTLVAFGAPVNCSGTITSTGYNLDSANTCHLHATGDLTNTAPLIGPLADNGGGLAGVGGTGVPFDGQAPLTHALLAGSLAINAANPANCPALDERGAARPGGACDIGAYEFGAKIIQVISFTLPSLLATYLSPYPLGGTASSGLVVSYTVSGAACSLAGSNLLLNSTGPCGVTAHQAGDANYNPAAAVPVSTTVGLALFLPLVLR